MLGLSSNTVAWQTHITNNHTYSQSSWHILHWCLQHAKVSLVQSFKKLVLHRLGYLDRYTLGAFSFRIVILRGQGVSFTINDSSHKKRDIWTTWSTDEAMTLLVKNPERLPDLVLNLCILDLPKKQRRWVSYDLMLKLDRVPAWLQKVPRASGLGNRTMLKPAHLVISQTNSLKLID